MITGKTSGNIGRNGNRGRCVDGYAVLLFIWSRTGKLIGRVKWTRGRERERDQNKK